jgi:DNA-binding transcriptional regulator YdaS (Cro superfamily)
MKINNIANAVEILSILAGSQRKAAKKMNISVGNIQDWKNGRKKVPPMRAVQIEQLTGGAVTRKMLRPDDWHLFWPELIEREKKEGEQ